MPSEKWDDNVLANMINQQILIAMAWAIGTGLVFYAMLTSVSLFVGIAIPYLIATYAMLRAWHELMDAADIVTEEEDGMATGNSPADGVLVVES